MFEKNIIDLKVVKNFKVPYFFHYASDDEIKEIIQQEDMYQNIKNIEKLKMNDWELHKQLIKEGINPNDLAKVIRNDDLEKLQEISSQNNFDFNQTIDPSIYERYSFVNERSVSLIDYAAYFGSIKCFKYLHLNNAFINNTGKYAIAGGNLEIIHLCEQNRSLFEESYEIAIRYHRNDIFKYLYENEIIKLNNLEEYGKKCVLYHNYEILSYLQNQGLEINASILDEIARIGNIFLLKYFLQENQIPKNYLFLSAKAGNVDIIKNIFEQEGIDVNAQDDCLSYKILI